MMSTADTAELQILLNLPFYLQTCNYIFDGIQPQNLSFCSAENSPNMEKVPFKTSDLCYFFLSLIFLFELVLFF